MTERLDDPHRADKPKSAMPSESPLAWLVFCDKHPEGFDYIVFPDEQDAKVYACEQDKDDDAVIPLYRASAFSTLRSAGTRLMVDEDVMLSQQHEIERLEALVYVPGVWKCAKCKMTLVSTTLNVTNGTAKANTEPQQCPNGCGPLWRKTEREAGNELCDRLDALSVQSARTRRIPTPEMIAAGEMRYLEMMNPSCRDFASNPFGKALVESIYNAMEAAR